MVLRRSLDFSDHASRMKPIWEVLEAVCGWEPEVGVGINHDQITSE